MKPSHGRLIVLSAPSGGGKTTISQELLRRDRRLVRSVSATTRDPRPGERDRRDYFFLSAAEFGRRARAGEFLEWANVHGHAYGTPRRTVLARQRAGRDVLLVIDVQGGLAVKRRHPEAVLIFVTPPSSRELEKRLRGRGTDSRRTIAQRLRNARREIRQSRHYDYCVENNRLAQAVADIRTIIAAERLRVAPGKPPAERSARP